jgi:hypothetical protein
MSKDKVGFGDDYSRRAPTRTMNAFVTVETRPCAGGADVIVTPRRGHAIMPEVDADTGEVVMHVRRDAGPRIGDSITVGRRNVIVAERRWSGKGTLQIRDEDTGAWMEVER